MPKAQARAPQPKQRALLAAAPRAASVPMAAIKVEKKKKKRDWKSMLKTGIQTAMRIAPAILPLFAQSHAPTAQLVSSLGSAAPPGLPSAPYGVPIAMQGSIATETGLRSSKAIKEDGRVVGAVISGVDFLADVGSGASGLLEGGLIRAIDLNPNALAWQGTRIQRESSLYSKYRYRSLSIMYQPVCPTTQPGQLILFSSSDASYTYTATGRAGVQLATGSQGSDMFQVWTMGCSAYVPDPANPTFYADADGSDIRFTSPGTAFLLSASTIAANQTLGQLYCAWEIELTVPRLDPTNGLAYAVLSSTVIGTNNSPLGGSGVTFDAETNVPVGYTVDAGGVGWVTNLPVGVYDCWYIFAKTTAGTVYTAGTSPTWTGVTTASVSVYPSGNWASTVVASVTQALSYARVSILQQGTGKTDVSEGCFRVSTTGIGVDVFGYLHISGVPQRTLASSLTMQSIESKVLTMERRLAELEAERADEPIVLHLPAGTSTRTGPPGMRSARPDF